MHELTEPLRFQMKHALARAAGVLFVDRLIDGCLRERVERYCFVLHKQTAMCSYRVIDLTRERGIIAKVIVPLGDVR